MPEQVIDELQLLRVQFDDAVFDFLNAYPDLCAWYLRIAERPAVQRGRRVNRTWGTEAHRVPERHDAADIDRTFGADPG